MASISASSSFLYSAHPARGPAHSETYVYTAGFSAAMLCPLATGAAAVIRNAAAHNNGHANAKPTRVRILFLQNLRCTQKNWPIVFLKREEGKLLAHRPYARNSPLSSQLTSASKPNEGLTKHAAPRIAVFPMFNLHAQPLRRRLYPDTSGQTPDRRAKE